MSISHSSAFHHAYFVWLSKYMKCEDVDFETFNYVFNVFII